MHPLSWFNLLAFLVAWAVLTYANSACVQLRYAIWEGFKGSLVVLFCLALAELMAYNVTYN